MLKTKVTEILGTDYPIIQGGMLWLSTAEFAAAASNAGCLGIITSANFNTPVELRKEIRKAKSLTDKPFGVNINLFPSVRPLPNEEFIEVLIEEGIKVVETSGWRSPEEYMPRLKQGGVKVIHKCGAVEHALKAERVGADFVMLVGIENGGNLGGNEITTMVLIPIAASRLKVPIIAGGGIADGRGLVAALALGAEGVVMGTRFIATKECPAHQNYKEWIVKAKETDTVVVEQSIRNAHRALRSKVTEKVLELEAKGASLQDLLPIIGGEQTKKVILKGDMEAGLAACGQIVGLIDDIPTVKELIDRIIAEAEVVGKRLASLEVFA